MPSRAHSYSGRRAALFSRDGKEVAVDLPLRFELGIELTVFCGSTSSPDAELTMTPMQTCVIKAKSAMQATGLPLGLASVVAPAPSGRSELTISCAETMVFIDEERSAVVCETLAPCGSNFSRRRSSGLSDLGGWLRGIGFPSHAVVVIADSADDCCVEKGIVSLDKLADALAKAVSVSSDGKACVQTDMRANLNRTRLTGIQRLAFRLARHVAAAERR